MCLMARQQLGLHTQETIMIGDTMETDIRGAQSGSGIRLTSSSPAPPSAKKSSNILTSPPASSTPSPTLLEGSRFVPHPFVGAN